MNRKMSRLEIVQKRISILRGSMVEVGVHEGDFLMGGEG
jgi:hypothetical protein